MVQYSLAALSARSALSQALPRLPVEAIVPLGALAADPAGQETNSEHQQWHIPPAQ